MSNPDESAPPVRIDVCHADIDPLYAILNDPRANERRLQERLLQRRIQAFIEGRRHQLEALAEAWHRRWPEMYSPELGRNFTDDEHFAEWAGRLKCWGDAVRGCGCRARNALRSWRAPEGILPDSDEGRSARLAYYIACRVVDPNCSAAEIGADLRQACTEANAHLLETLYLPGGWLGRICYAIDQAVRHPRRRMHARPDQPALSEQTDHMSGAIALSPGAAFDLLAFRLLGLGDDLLLRPRMNGYDGDPYLTKEDYQRLCNIVCERVPGTTASDWWSYDVDQRIACLQAALDKPAPGKTSAKMGEALDSLGRTSSDSCDLDEAGGQYNRRVTVPVQRSAVMRLKVSAASANELLLVHVTQGLKLHTKLWADYKQKKDNGTFNEEADRQRHLGEINVWTSQVVDVLRGIFPMEREEHLFHHPDQPAMRAVSEADYHWKCTAFWLMDLVKGLDKIRQTAIPEYTDLPIKERLHVEDIDSFRKVRDVNPDAVAAFLKDGYLDWAEDKVQLALESILSVPNHKKDWGGEGNDLYTYNVIVNGCPRPTAFLLKGNGLKVKVMEIKHCGKNGDQVIRLFQSPADLFVIQFVGNIAESVIQHAHGEIARLKTQGKEAHFLIMDGQNTARVLRAYGKIE